ncbi:hypothetical protein WJX73_000943 [Symbiochloris irregularis]|uniref:Uncharacterized protein n=1 Tax=Symbiochloris irregularis TaxID=706552 RepID=A0AAW1NRB6_9CHLO
MKHLRELLTCIEKGTGGIQSLDSKETQEAECGIYHIVLRRVTLRQQSISAGTLWKCSFDRVDMQEHTHILLSAGAALDSTLTLQAVVKQVLQSGGGALTSQQCKALQYLKL